MNKLVPMQSFYCSMEDENKICSFDIEVLAEPTAPLLHPMSRFWLINSGEGILLLNNKRYTLKPGTVVSILPWQISDIVEVSEPLQFFVMAYYFDNINEIIKLFYNPGSAPLSIVQSLNQNPVLYLEGEALEAVRHSFLQIKEEIGMESTLDTSSIPSPELRNLYITNKLIDIMLYFIRSEKPALSSSAAHTVDPSEIFQYLYCHLNEKITLTMLSRIFCMSEYAISKYITETTGLSFFDLLNEMRIGKTINFLLYTDLTLDELAEILGFVDSAHISKVFSARTGMKVNEFRNTYQNIGSICRIKDHKDFYLIVSYIYRHYMEPLTPRQIGDRFRISPKELNRILLYQVEMNFSDYLNFIRVNRASELLLKTSKSILEVALEVGYQTEKTLSRNFLKFRSMTPGKFRHSIALQDNEETFRIQ